MNETPAELPAGVPLKEEDNTFEALTGFVLAQQIRMTTSLKEGVEHLLVHEPLPLNKEVLSLIEAVRGCLDSNPFITFLEKTSDFSQRVGSLLTSSGEARDACPRLWSFSVIC